MRIIILGLLLLVGCAKEPTHFRGIAHMHPYHIQIGHNLSNKEKKEIEKLLTDVFEEVDQVYNHWNPQSELSRALSTPKIDAILILAHSFYELTDGWYNPSLGAPITAFKKTGVLPEKTLPPTYDLDGMLKGFVIDLIAEKLLEKGYQNLYIEWGGDLKVRGKHPQKREWQVLVNGHILPLKNQALATSGSEQQTWQVGEKTYTHIMNPHTQQMLEVKNDHVHEVSVLAPSCALADALATACMACGTLDQACSFAQKIKETHPDIEFWITAYEF